MKPNQIVQQDEWDWIVVGTGMGGATFGHALARAGRTVLFLEKGLDQHINNDRQTGDFMEVLHPAPARRTVQDHLSTGRSADTVHDVTRRKQVRPILGCGTGGSSALYGMVMERFWPEDFRPAQPSPNHWPIDFHDMEPFYREAESLYQVSSLDPDPLRAQQSFHHRRRPPLSPGGTALMAGLAGKGLHPYALPLARTWGTPCPLCQSHLCSHNCKNDAAKMCLEPALRHHGAALLTGAEVLKITSTASRVTGVVARVNGQTRRFSARHVALAAGALHTPLLLLASASDQWPRGLANRSGLVGRYLMRHYIDLVGLPRWAPLPDNEDLKEFGVNDFYLTPKGKFGTLADFGRMPPLPVVLEDMDNDIAQAPAIVRALWRTGRPLAGRALRFLLARTRFLALIMEDRPFADNRVEPGPTPGDVRIHYTIGPSEQDRIRRARALVRQRLKPAPVLILPNADNTKLLAHACGTCRMGADPLTSVVDPGNRAHGLENLYIVDGSYFPTSGGVNPALTIAANALRAARAVTQAQSAVSISTSREDHYAAATP